MKKDKLIVFDSYRVTMRVPERHIKGSRVSDPRTIAVRNDVKFFDGKRARPVNWVLFYDLGRLGMYSKGLANLRWALPWFIRIFRRKTRYRDESYHY